MTDWILPVAVGVLLLLGWIVGVPASLKASVTVASPLGAAFAFVADPRNTPRWNPRVKSVTIADEPTRLGTTYQLHLGDGALRVTLPYTVVGFEQDTMFAAETKTARMTNRFQYSFESSDSGSRITASSDAMVPILQAIVIGIIGPSRTRRNLSQMKAAIEGHRMAP